MKRFHVHATIQNEPILLTVEPMNAPIGTEDTFFKVRKGRKWLAVIKMDGECNLVSDTRTSLSAEDIRRLCREICTHLKRSDDGLTVINL